MTNLYRTAAIVTGFILVLPAAASADLYYYAPNTTSGAFNYGSSQYIPASAMPYVAYGQQMAQQYQQQYMGSSYSPYGYQMQPQYQTYPSHQTSPSYGYQSQSQSQSQYQSSYPSYTTSYNYPTYNMPSYPTYQNTGYGYTGSPTYGSSSGSNTNFGGPYGQLASSYPSGTYGPFGQQLCYWSDYPTYAPCGSDPQQWLQDSYTGQYY